MKDSVSNYSTPIQGKILSKGQTTLLSKSLIVAGISFLGIFVFSWLLYFLLGTISETKINSVVTFLYIISTILIIGTMFMSMFMWARIEKAKIATLISMISLYSIGEGIAFGILFFAVHLSSEYDLSGLSFVFLIGGGLFCVSGLIGSILSQKAAFTLGKFLMWISISLLILLPILLILGLCGVGVSYSFMWILYALMGVLFMGYIAYDINMIKKMSSFISVEDTAGFKMSLMFGFKLLIDFVGLLWILIRLYLMTGRR